MVLPTTVELIEDVRKAPDDVLGARELFREVRMTYAGSTQAHFNYIVHSVGLYPQLLE
jgi:hypothetical protein